MRKNIFVATSLLLFLPSMLNAASIRLSPVNVEILSDQTASSISLYNQSNESADLQVRIFEWTRVCDFSNMIKKNRRDSYHGIFFHIT